MKDIKSLLLILLSTGLVSTWIYHLYDKGKYSNRTREIYIKDSIAVAEAVKDSLQKLYTVALDQLSYEKLNTDSANSTLKGELGQKLKEINKLKNEIGDILKKRNFNQADLGEARGKIKELQEMIAGMKDENSMLAEERKRLSGILDQLNTEVAGLQQSIHKITAENRQMAQTINEASTFFATNLHLSAVTVKAGNREVEAQTVRRANKFVISFIVTNNVAADAYHDLFIAITAPDGKVLQDNLWDAGTITTKSLGQKNFTLKLRIEYNKGEQKKVIYALEPREFLEGTYRMQVFHNGVMIGETLKTLS